MCHDIDPPGQLPAIVDFGQHTIGRSRAALAIAEDDARIGCKQIDGAQLGLDTVDKPGHVRLIAHIGLESDPADCFRHALGSVRMQIHNGDFNAVFRQSPAQGGTDTVTTTGHYCDRNLVGCDQAFTCGSQRATKASRFISVCRSDRGG